MADEVEPYGNDVYCGEIEKTWRRRTNGFQLDLGYLKPLGSNHEMQVLPEVVPLGYSRASIHAASGPSIQVKKFLRDRL